MFDHQAPLHRSPQHTVARLSIQSINQYVLSFTDSH